MEAALWAAKTGLDAQQTQMTVTANNLANVATTGFKASRGVFEDLLYQNVTQVGSNTSQTTQSPSGLQLGTGVRMVATETLNTQGSLSQTGNSLDLAVQGRGFFQVLLPSGQLAYTRDGSFQLSSTGQVVTAEGYPLQPAMTIPTGTQSITIGSDGTVSVQLAGQSAPTTVGTVQLADFVNPAGLQNLGGNLLAESASSGAATTGTPGVSGLGTLVQGSLEASNVNVVEEMVNMIQIQRAYEMNSKAVQTCDQMLQYADQNM
jgi:flagellar basal-body rod protein FlgG